MKLRSLPVVLALMLLFGCGLPSRPQPSLDPVSGSSASEPHTGPDAPAAISAEGDYEYRLMKPNRFDPNDVWLVDEDGNTIPDAEDFMILYDMETGEPQCKYKQRTEDSGEDNEWGESVTRIVRALYDMDGKLLRDWEEYRYEAGRGNLIIRSEELNYGPDGGPPPAREDFETALWDFRADEAVMEGVRTIQLFRDGEYLVTDLYGSPMGFVDQAGTMLQGPPDTPYYSVTAESGYLIANTLNTSAPEGYDPNDLENVLLDRDYTEIAAYKLISHEYYGLYADGVFYFREDNPIGDGDISGIMDGGGNVLLSFPDLNTLAYYDDEQHILHPITTLSTYSLVAMDGTILADGFTYLTPDLLWDDEGPAQRYVGIRDGSAVLIDRTGTELASAPLPEDVTTVYAMGGGFYSYTIEQNTAVYYGQSQGLLNAELEEIVPPQVGASYNWASTYAGESTRQWAEELAPEDDLLLSSYWAPNEGPYLYSLLRRDGSVVVDGLSMISDIGPNRIAVTRGFSVGLMDWEGNWIVKHSIFSDWMDD